MWRERNERAEMSDFGNQSPGLVGLVDLFVKIDKKLEVYNIL